MSPAGSDLAARIRARLEAHAPSDPVLAVGTPSAVLIPLFVEDGAGEPQVWLLRKSDALRRHGGQVALPGGKADPTDASLVDTALREAEEEIALPRRDVEIVGRLERQQVITGFVVTPFVGIVPPAFRPTPDAVEVARVFSAPLAAFRGPGEPREVSVMGFARRVPSYGIEGEIVWGATAAILRRLAERVL